MNGMNIIGKLNLTGKLCRKSHGNSLKGSLIGNLECGRVQPSASQLVMKVLVGLFTNTIWGESLNPCILTKRERRGKN